MADQSIENAWSRARAALKGLARAIARSEEGAQYLVEETMARAKDRQFETADDILPWVLTTCRRVAAQANPGALKNWGDFADHKAPTSKKE